MFFQSLKDGIKKGFETVWMLAKVLVPVYFLVTILDHTPFMVWIAYAFEPLMGIFNLPGEAALALVLGNVLNIYASLGVIRAFDFTIHEITTLAIMISFSHSLIVETVVTSKMGIKYSHVLLIRISLAIFAGIVVGRLGVLIW